MHKEPRAVPSLIAVTVLLLALPAGALAGGIVGQLQSEGAALNGDRVPSGTAVPVGYRLEAQHGPAVVHLNAGQVVHLAQGSRIRFTESGPGEVAFAVESGAAYVMDDGGEVVGVGPGGEATLFAQNESPIGEGREVEPEEGAELCHLRDPTPERVQLCTEDDPDDRSCRWQRIDVEASELAGHLAHGDVYRDKSLRTEEMSDEIECRRSLFLLLPVETAVVGVGNAVVLGELLQDDGPPASPVRPR